MIENMISSEQVVLAWIKTINREKEYNYKKEISRVLSYDHAYILHEEFHFIREGNAATRSS